jgi:SAM-dependent methyltransferase
MSYTVLSHSDLFNIDKNSSFWNRALATVRCIDELYPPYADCGEPNPLKFLLEDVFDIRITSLTGDFNRDHLYGRYGTIFCFEVLEHLYNPLFFLESVRDILYDDGILYLSTPYQWPHFLRGRFHFHEMTTDRLTWLLNEANLKVVDKHKITIAGKLTNHLYGFRPILRYFQKTRLLKIVKA